MTRLLQSQEFPQAGMTGPTSGWERWCVGGAVLEQPRNHEAAAAENFTNLGAVGGRICFHKNVNGMWLIRQCMETWAAGGRVWTVPELVAAAEKVTMAHGVLDVDDPD